MKVSRIYDQSVIGNVPWGREWSFPVQLFSLLPAELLGTLIIHPGGPHRCYGEDNLIPNPGFISSLLKQVISLLDTHERSGNDLPPPSANVYRVPTRCQALS